MPLNFPYLRELSQFCGGAPLYHIDHFKKPASNSAQSGHERVFEPDACSIRFCLRLFQTDEAAAALNQIVTVDRWHRRRRCECSDAGGSLLCVRIVVAQIEVAEVARVAQNADDDTNEGAAGIVERGGGLAQEDAFGGYLKQE